MRQNLPFKSIINAHYVIVFLLFFLIFNTGYLSSVGVNLKEFKLFNVNLYTSTRHEIEDAINELGGIIIAKDDETTIYNCCNFFNEKASLFLSFGYDNNFIKVLYKIDRHTNEDRKKDYFSIVLSELEKKYGKLKKTKSESDSNTHYYELNIDDIAIVVINNTNNDRFDLVYIFLNRLQSDIDKNSFCLNMVSHEIKNYHAF